MELPSLREELSLHPGPAATDGAPTWTLRDPVRNRFFQLTWTAFEILARWHGHSAAQIVASVNAETTLTITEDDVMAVAAFLQMHQLTAANGATDIKRFLRIAQAESSSWLQWLLHHYLFFRIPLLRPDAFLERTMKHVAWIYTRGFATVTLLALLTGVFLVYRQWDVFQATLIDRLTITGMLCYSIAYASAKLIHELAHAYTAKRLGCRVPTMGVAFLVMWPVLYTDVNDTWTLPRRGDRLSVGAAGILAEIAIAAWSLLAWSFLPDGALRGTAFAVATVTLISSLAVNLSPFMRFDGYYLLMDALNLPNLHQRSFALARWWLRETLFDLHAPPPEEQLPLHRRWLILFAFLVWIYRLTLFLGIAVLVYHFFIKIVGVGLFAVEIGWFVALPIYNEIKDWQRNGYMLRQTQRKKWLLRAACVAAIFLIVPWRDHISAPAVLKAPIDSGLYVPHAAKLASIAVTQGQHVTAGQTLFTFTSPDLDSQRTIAKARQDSAEYALASISFDSDFRAQSDSLREQVASTSAARTSLAAEAERLTITAPIDGIVFDVQPDIHVGDWLSPKDRLATIQSAPQSLVEAYVGEDDVQRLSQGDSALFFPDGATHAVKHCRVSRIDPSPVHALTDPEMAAIYGGKIPVRTRENLLIPESALYRVQLEVQDADAPSLQQRGLAHISGHAQSLLVSGLRSVIAVLIREFGT